MDDARAPQPHLAPSAWCRVERLFDSAFGSAANPLRQLGTLAFLALWLLAVSGVWLYAVLDTSASGAYASIDALSQAPGTPGWLMRSLHRYAADAFVVLTVLHLLRELLHGRWRHFRRFTWLTGTAVLPLIAVSAIGGFWLNWDRLGQFSAIATAAWLDSLPLLAHPLARNFIGTASVSDRLFSLFVFVHLGAPLLLVFGLWFHLQRLTRAAVFPPRRLGWGTLAALLLLSLWWPVRSQGPADLSQVPPELEIDWWILGLHPLMYASSPVLVWCLVLGGFALLLSLPWWPTRRAASPVAVVDPDNCNGCTRCFADCPYAAITMVEHPNGRVGRQLAVVDADLCAACGICAGSCPSSTPFRHGERLVSGIDMPQQPIDTLRSQLHEGLAARPPDSTLVVFACTCGADVARVAAPDVQVLPLICAGQLPPSFIEFALRDGAAGVLVTTCREGGCEFRLGARWTAERLLGAREPRLRDSVDAQRLMQVQADRGEGAVLALAVDTLRERLKQIKALHR